MFMKIKISSVDLVLSYCSCCDEIFKTTVIWQQSLKRRRRCAPLINGLVEVEFILLTIDRGNVNTSIRVKESVFKGVEILLCFNVFQMFDLLYVHVNRFVSIVDRFERIRKEIVLLGVQIRSLKYLLCFTFHFLKRMRVVFWLITTFHR